jgi:hypothetical protein
MILIEYILETVINHQVDQLAVSHALPPPGPVQCIRDAAHVFRPARYDHFGIPGGNRLGSQANRLKARGANLVHRESRHFLRHSGVQRDLPRRVLSQSSLEHVTENYFIDMRRIQPDTLHGLFEGGDTQIDGRDDAQ